VRAIEAATARRQPDRHHPAEEPPRSAIPASATSMKSACARDRPGRQALARPLHVRHALPRARPHPTRWSRRSRSSSRACRPWSRRRRSAAEQLIATTAKVRDYLLAVVTDAQAKEAKEPAGQVREQGAAARRAHARAGPGESSIRTSSSTRPRRTSSSRRDDLTRLLVETDTMRRLEP